MVRTRNIHFRATNDEYEKIKANMSQGHYSRLADFLRDAALQDPLFRVEIRETHTFALKTYSLVKQLVERRG